MTDCILRRYESAYIVAGKFNKGFQYLKKDDSYSIKEDGVMLIGKKYLLEIKTEYRNDEKYDLILKLQFTSNEQTVKLTNVNLPSQEEDGIYWGSLYSYQVKICPKPCKLISFGRGYCKYSTNIITVEFVHDKITLFKTQSDKEEIMCQINNNCSNEITVDCSDDEIEKCKDANSLSKLVSFGFKEKSEKKNDEVDSTKIDCPHYNENSYEKQKDSQQEEQQKTSLSNKGYENSTDKPKHKRKRWWFALLFLCCGGVVVFILFHDVNKNE